MISAGLCSVGLAGDDSALRNKRSFCAYRITWLPIRGKRKRRAFDQQPVEACAVGVGLLAGLSRYGKKPLEERGLVRLQLVPGRYDLQIALYDRTTVDVETVCIRIEANGKTRVRNRRYLS